MSWVCHSVWSGWWEPACSGTLKARINKESGSVKVSQGLPQKHSVTQHGGVASCVTVIQNLLTPLSNWPVLVSELGSHANMWGGFGGATCTGLYCLLVAVSVNPGLGGSPPCWLVPDADISFHLIHTCQHNFSCLFIHSVCVYCKQLYTLRSRPINGILPDFWTLFPVPHEVTSSSSHWLSQQAQPHCPRTWSEFFLLQQYDVRNVHVFGFKQWGIKQIKQAWQEQ